MNESHEVHTLACEALYDAGWVHDRMMTVWWNNGRGLASDSAVSLEEACKMEMAHRTKARE